MATPEALRARVSPLPQVQEEARQMMMAVAKAASAVQANAVHEKLQRRTKRMEERTDRERRLLRMAELRVLQLLSVVPLLFWLTWSACQAQAAPRRRHPEEQASRWEEYAQPSMRSASPYVRARLLPAEHA